MANSQQYIDRETLRSKIVAGPYETVHTTGMVDREPESTKQ